MSAHISPRFAAVLLAACMACGGSSSGPSGGTQQTGTVSGTVTAAGAGVAGATLQLSRTGATTRSTTSGQNGSFQFTSVEVGSWTLGITAPTGFDVSGSASTTVNVTANQTATANFQLQQVQLPPPQSGTINISMTTQSTFDPASVNITVGSTIVWTNNDAIEHNTTGSAWASGNLAPGATFQRVMDQTGTFNYSCTLHSGMNGVITVQ